MEIYSCQGSPHLQNKYGFLPQLDQEKLPLLSILHGEDRLSDAFSSIYLSTNSLVCVLLTGEIVASAIEISTDITFERDTNIKVSISLTYTICFVFYLIFSN